jgi:hypothetical protein
MLWTYILDRHVKGSSPIEIHRCLRSVCGEDAIDVNSDDGSFVLRALKRTVVTGPAQADQPQQQQQRPKTRFIHNDQHISASELCAAYRLENQRYGHHQRTWLWKSLCIMGTKNAHHQTQNSPKNICARLHQHGEKTADAFLTRIITGDEPWVHQYDPLMKRK